MVSIADWVTLKNGLADWITNTVALPVLWAGQEAPRRDYPYVTIDVVAGPMRLGHDVDYVYDEPGPSGDVRVITRGDREMTVSVEVLQSFEGQPYSHATDALAIASELQSSLERRPIRDALREAGLSILEQLSPVQNRRTALDAGTLDRRGFDIRTGLVSVWDPGSQGAESWIRDVVIGATIDGEDSEDLYGTNGRIPISMGGGSVIRGAIRVSTPAATALDGTNWAKVAGTTDAVGLVEFSMPADGRLQYDGAITRTVIAHAEGTYVSDVQGANVQVALAKDGVILTDSIQGFTTHTADHEDPCSVSWPADLVTNNYLEVWAKADTALSLTARQLALVVHD